MAHPIYPTVGIVWPYGNGIFDVHNLYHMRIIILISVLLLSITQSGLHAQTTAAQAYDAGLDSLDAGNFKGAVKRFEEAVKIDPKFAAAWYELAWCYNEIGEPRKAIAASQKSIELSGEDGAVYFEIGYAYDMEGNVEQAKANYQKSLRLQPDLLRSYLSLANVIFDFDQDFASALKYYQEYTKRANRNDIESYVWFRKAYCEVEANQLDSALLSLDYSTLANSNNTLAWSEKGYVYQQKKDASRSISSYQKALSIDSMSYDANLGIADTYRLLSRDADKALPHYLKAYKAKSKSSQSLYGAAWCYNAKKEYDKALTHIKKAIELSDKYYTYYNEMGYANYGLKNYDDALKAIEQSLKLAENNVALYYKGLVYIAKNERASAETMLKTLKSRNAVEATYLESRLK